MLAYLRIVDFALLDDVEISLGPGMTVITGETGAGKSLVIDAVSLLRGGRASADLLRTGADEARVEAVFSPSLEGGAGPGVLGAAGGAAVADGSADAERRLRERLSRVGIEDRAGSGGAARSVLSEEGLVVRRVVGRGGRSRAFLSGQLATAAALSEVCGGLIDIASQHEHQTLMEVGRHLGILDEFGVPAAQRAEMAAAYDRLRAAAEALAAASLDERTRLEREEFLRFQLKELEQARLRPGEDEELRRERERLRSAERLHRVARRSEELLYSREGAILEELGIAARELAEVQGLDEQLRPYVSQLGEAQALLEDAAHGLRRYADGLSADPERLAEIDERLHLLSRILRKHGPDVDTALRRQADMAAELSRLEAHEEQSARAQAEVEAARAEAQRVAEGLTAARQRVAARLSEEVSKALRDLSMGGARLEPRIEERWAKDGDPAALLFSGTSGRARKLGRDGWDRCELLLSPNPGEEARPLQRIASGGELSRIMLAMKRILGQADGVPTYIFDEIDAGIGGATADRVGRQIRALARTKQVLCITHLAQIAACADDHLLVEKRTEDGRTRTVVRRLGPKERREELARMLGGARVTSRARAHADELLREAK